MPRTYETCPRCGQLTPEGRRRLTADRRMILRGYDTDLEAVGDQMAVAVYRLWPWLPLLGLDPPRPRPD